MAELVSKEESKALSQVEELRAHESAAVSSMKDATTHLLACGTIFCDWKEHLPHGTFQEFCERHSRFSERRIRDLMKVATYFKTAPGAVLEPDVSIKQLLALVKQQNSDQPTTPPKETAIEDAEPSPLEQLDDAVAEKVEQAIDKGLVPAPESSNGELSRGVEALRQYEETSQEELVESVLDGRQTWDQAISTGEIPEPSIEDVCAAATSEIERFCRYLWKEWDDKIPDDPWLDHLGRRGLAKEQLKKALGTIRAAKTKPCPACDGQGCKSCQETGRVDGMTFKQLAGAKNS